MKLYYGSFAHIFSILLLIIVLIGIIFIFKNRSIKTRKIVILLIMLLNLIQHIFKSFIWPTEYGNGFSINNTANNFCALLIIINPFIFISKNKVLKDFSFTLGSIGSFVAIAVPYWFVSNNADLLDKNMGLEYLRFYVCHLLLFLESLLPVLLDTHKISFKNFYKHAFIMIICMCIIVLNDIIFGTIFYGSIDNAVEFLKGSNPLWIIKPVYGSGLDKLMDILVLLCPKVFRGSDTKEFVPVLWNSLFIYIWFTNISFITALIFKEKNKK